MATLLARDADVAADIEQETWRIALESPPADLRAPGNWLRQVARNVFRQRLRKRSPIIADESAEAAHEETPAELIDRRETARAVASAVERLGEPYRGVVVDRYFHGMEPQDIARRRGIPSSTVRTQLERGLAELRADIRRRLGDSSVPRLSCLAGLSTIANSELRGAAWKVAMAQSSNITMRTKLAVAFLALAAFVIPVVVLKDKWSDDLGGSDDRRGMIDLGRGGDELVRRAEAVSAVPPDTRPVEDLSTIAPADLPIRLRLHFLNAETLGGDGMAVSLMRTDPAAMTAGIPRKDLTIRRLVPDPEISIQGFFPDGLPSGKDPVTLWISIDHPRHVPYEAFADMKMMRRRLLGDAVVFELDVSLGATYVVQGHVQDVRGDAWQDAFVGLYRLDGDVPSFEPETWCRTTGEGVFNMRLKRQDRMLLVVAADETPAILMPVNLSDSGALDLGAITLTEGVAIAGQVRAADRGVSGVRLVANHLPPESAENRESAEAIDEDVIVAGRETYMFPRGARTAERRDAATWTDDDGRFRIRGLIEGDHWLQIVGFVEGSDTVIHDDVLGALVRRTPAPAEDAVFALPTAKITFRATLGDQPAAAVVAVRPMDERDSVTFVQAPHRSVLVLADRDYDIVAGRTGCQAVRRTVRAPAAGGEITETFAFTAAKEGRFVVLRMNEAERHEVAEAYVTFAAVQPPNADPGDERSLFLRGYVAATAKRDAGDVFTIANVDLLPGRYIATIVPRRMAASGSDPYLYPDYVEIDVPREGTITIESPLKIGGRVRVAVHTANGVVLPAIVKVNDVEGRRRLPRVDSGALRDPAFALDGIYLPGEYTIVVRVAGVPERTETVTIEAAKTTDVDVVVERP